MKKPTIEQFSKYQSVYDYFNKTLFGNQLAPCLLVFRDGRASRRGIVLGHFAPGRWSKGDTTCHEISLNPEALNRDFADTMATLVHEMCHQWQQDHGTPPRRCYHDREWAAKMLEVGLVPSATGQPEGKQTGQSMTHYIAPEGRFEAAMRKMPDSIKMHWISGQRVTLGGGDESEGDSEEKSKNKVKYSCPGDCGSNVWGKPGMSIICGECDESFEEA